MLNSLQSDLKLPITEIPGRETQPIYHFSSEEFM